MESALIDERKDITLVTVRAATVADIDAVLAFWRVGAEGTSISDDPDGVAALITRDPGALLLAETGGQIVGTVIAGWDGWRAHLYRLAVHPDQRRRGIGTALLEAAERRLLALGARRLDAMVLDRNELAHHAWQAAGYERDPEWTRWIKK